jgi:AmmeMemoRadiSam system protein B
MNVRKATFAGSWYPDIPEGCEREIKYFLSRANALEDPEEGWVGGIVPHAGWYFSGKIACRVIHALKKGPPPDAFVVFGMHLHPKASNYIMTEGAWETPFGNIEIESELAGELTKQFPFKIETARHHSKDNTIELQLPFIKYFFPNAKLVPIGVPPAEASIEIGKAAARIASSLGLRIKSIGSTDLTHYGLNYGFIPEGMGPSAVEWVRSENDRKVIDHILSLNPAGVIREALANQNACCSGAVASAISAAREMGATHGKQISYATSYDKSPGDSFVGYVGIVF